METSHRKVFREAIRDAITLLADKQVDGFAQSRHP